MAQRAISESIGRTLFATYQNVPQDFAVIDFSWKQPLEQWQNYCADTKHKLFVVKPDHLIGKRGKQGLLGVKLTAEQAEKFATEQNGREVQGKQLTRFVVTPFVAHEGEYYVSITTAPLVDEIAFSATGGVDIEEQWDSVKKLAVPVAEDAPDFSSLLSSVDENERKAVESFLQDLLKYFREFGLAFLEINPFTVVDGAVVPLDFKGRIDNAEFFTLQKRLDIYALMAGSEEKGHPAEVKIRQLDGVTDASLKLKLLNENGRIWPLIAGGGASIIYFDALVDEGLASEIGFYGEYSGNPPFELMYEYAKTIIDLLIASSAKNKVLLIAGANANFTNILSTFKAIIKVLNERADELKDVQILVRRGGPFVEEAFTVLRGTAEKLGLNIYLEGVDRPLVAVVEEIK